VAAASVALAASLCAMAARLSAKQMADAPDLAAAADVLRDRAALLCQADADAYGRVMAAIRLDREPEAEDRRRLIADALSAASDVPLEVVAIAARVAAMAARITEEGNPNLLGDAVTSALVAESGARAAAAIVLINLADSGQDDRRSRVAVLLEEIAGSARRAWRRIESLSPVAGGPGSGS